MHMCAPTHARTRTYPHMNLKETTKDVISFYDLLPMGEKTDVLALNLPSYRNGFCEVTRKKDTYLAADFFFSFLFCLFSLLD